MIRTIIVTAFKLAVILAFFGAFLGLLEMPPIPLFQEADINGTPLAKFRLWDLPIGKNIKVDSLIAITFLFVLAWFVVTCVFPLLNKRDPSSPPFSIARPMRFVMTGLAALFFAFFIYAIFNAHVMNEPRNDFTTQAPDTVGTMSYSPDLSEVVAGSPNGSTFIWSSNRDNKPKALALGNTVSYGMSAYAPSGDLLAIGSDNGNIQLWNADGTKFKREISAQNGRVTFLVFAHNPTNLMLAAGFENGTVSIWKMLPGGDFIPPVWSENLHELEVTALAFDASDQFIASGSKDHSIRVYHIEPKLRLADPEGHPYPVLALGFIDVPGTSQFRLFSVSKGGRLASYLFDRQKQISYQDPNNTIGRYTNTLLPSKDIRAAAFHPATNLVAFADNDKTVHLWRMDAKLNKSCPVDSLTLQYNANVLDFDRNGNYLMTGDEVGFVSVWGLARTNLPKAARGQIPCGYTSLVDETNQEIVPHFGGPVKSIAWDEKTGVAMLAVTNANKSLFVCTHVLPGESSQCHQEKGPQDDVTLAQYGSGGIVVTVSRDGYIRAIQQQGGNPISVVAETGWMDAPINIMAVNPKKPQAIFGNARGELLLWDWTTRNMVYSKHAHPSEVSALQFNEDGDKWVSGDQDGNLILWNGSDFANKQELKRGDAKAHDQRITAVAFSYKGRLLASATASGEKNVTLWNAKNGTLVTDYTVKDLQPSQLVFSRDQQEPKLVVGGDSDFVLVFSHNDPTPKKFDAHVEPILSLGVDKENNLVALGTDGKQLQEWKVANLTQLAPPRVLSGPDEFISSIPLRRYLLAFLVPAALIFGMIWSSFQVVNGQIAKFMYGDHPNYDAAKARKYIGQLRDGSVTQRIQTVTSNKVLPAPNTNEMIGAVGPGELLVQEGHAAVLERNGTFSRIVLGGKYFLAKGECAVMSIPLYTRTLTVDVPNVWTRDQMCFENIKLAVRHKIGGLEDRYKLAVDVKEQNKKDAESKDITVLATRALRWVAWRGEPVYDGKYKFEQEIVRYYLWNPEHTDYEDTLKNLVKSQTIELIAGEYFEDLYFGFGTRHNLRELLRQRVAGIMEKRGVEVEAIIVSELTLDKKFATKIQLRKQLELDRYNRLARAQTRHDAAMIEQEAKSALRGSLIRQISDPLRDKNRGVIIDSEIAVRYIEAIERLSLNFVREDLELEQDEPKPSVIHGEARHVEDEWHTPGVDDVSPSANGASASAPKATK